MVINKKTQYGVHGSRNSRPSIYGILLINEASGKKTLLYIDSRCKMSF